MSEGAGSTGVMKPRTRYRPPKANGRPWTGARAAPARSTHDREGV
jgi:hypothetical protein